MQFLSAWSTSIHRPMPIAGIEVQCNQLAFKLLGSACNPAVELQLSTILQNSTNQKEGILWYYFSKTWVVLFLQFCV